MDNSHKAPLTLELIVNVNHALSRLTMTRNALREQLNKFLPSKRQIKDNHAGTVKLNRWLNPTGKEWCEPRGEIVLALKKWLESNKK